MGVASTARVMTEATWTSCCVLERWTRCLPGGFSSLIEGLEQSNIPILVQPHDWARLPESFHREIERDYVVLLKGDKA